MTRYKAKTRLTFRADPEKPLSEDNELVIDEGETFEGAERFNTEKMLKRGIIEQVRTRSKSDD